MLIRKATSENASGILAYLSAAFDEYRASTPFRAHTLLPRYGPQRLLCGWGSSWMLCFTRHIAYGHHLSQLDASQIISISTSPVFSTTP